jgi:putative endonuclease
VNSSPKPRPDGTPSGTGASGARAESIAADFLMRRGLAIVGRNFRTRAGEIDLIARDGATLVFVEVRMRRSQRFGGALESITAAKRARIVAAANGYLAMIGREPPCRFDAIVMDRLHADAVSWQRDIFAADR